VVTHEPQLAAVFSRQIHWGTPDAE